MPHSCFEAQARSCKEKDGKEGLVYITTLWTGSCKIPAEKAFMGGVNCLTPHSGGMSGLVYMGGFEETVASYGAFDCLNGGLEVVYIF